MDIPGIAGPGLCRVMLLGGLTLDLLSIPTTLIHRLVFQGAMTHHQPQRWLMFYGCDSSLRSISRRVSPISCRPNSLRARGQRAAELHPARLPAGGVGLIVGGGFRATA